MERKTTLQILGIILITGICGPLFIYIMQPKPQAAVIQSHFDELLLLVPDEEVLNGQVNLQNPKISVWINAAQEEGIHVKSISDANFLAMTDSDKAKYKGILLVDELHPFSTSALQADVKRYVQGGGNVMLTFDFGIMYKDPAGRPFYYDISPFSDLAGVDYSTYKLCYDRHPGRDISGCYVGRGKVTGRLSTLQNLLHVPPGKSMSYAEQPREFIYAPVTAEFPTGYTSTPGLAAGIRGDKPFSFNEKRAEQLLVKGSDPIDPQHEITGYLAQLKDPGTGEQIAYVSYDSFVTSPRTDSHFFQEILSSPQFGVQASVNLYGLGKVLFVNLPVGKYKSYGTDGMLQAGFLHYFAVDMLRFPYLAAVPEGEGGMVMNVHVDCGDANEAIQVLDKEGVWNAGPFSIHYVAGPDCRTPGDRGGLDVLGNTVTQQNLLMLSSKGHEIGSHGGWIHDYYGARVRSADGTYSGVPESYNDIRAPEFRNYLDQNKDAIEAVNKKPVREYSAPQGNMPRWTVQWAKCHGIVGYYSLGNTGMAPTRMYRQTEEGIRPLDDSVDEYSGSCPHTGKLKPIWAFPVTPYHLWYATFDDLGGDAEWHYPAVPVAEVSKWLSDLVDFVVQEHTARLFYFHPPGVIENGFIDALKVMESRAQAYKNRFKWYTMTQLAEFLSARQKVTWEASKLDSNEIQINASHPSNLEGYAWVLPKADYLKPKVVSGKIRVKDDIHTNEWIVSVNAGKTVAFKAKSLQ